MIRIINAALDTFVVEEEPQTVLVQPAAEGVVDPPQTGLVQPTAPSDPPQPVPAPPPAKRKITRMMIRGVLDPKSLTKVQFDEYQREELPAGTVDAIIPALINGNADDICVGVRHLQVINPEPGVYLVPSPGWCIDGRQRHAAAQKILATMPGVLPHVGIRLILGTDYRFEKNLFDGLNSRTKVAANIKLRNRRDDYPVLQKLYELTTDDTTSILCKRVCWRQKMKDQELLTARTFLIIAAHLHSRSGQTKTSNLRNLGATLQGVADTIGETVVVQNVRTFFDVINFAWPLPNRRVRAGAACNQVKENFLKALVLVLCQHDEFWQGNQLVVDRYWRERMKKKIDLSDEEYDRLAGGGHAELRRLTEDIRQDLNDRIPEEKKLQAPDREALKGTRKPPGPEETPTGGASTE
jgi:hypothetical protein